jgi:ABC-type uncharacterized transport system substrate-binding protein
VSLSSGDEVPHIFTRKSRLRPKEFLISSAKRLLQQNLPRAVASNCSKRTCATESEIEAAFAAFAGQQSDALFVGADPFLSSRQDLIIALAAHHAVPAIYDLRAATAAGGLISYASSNLEAQQQAGVYAGRILKVARASA